MEKIRLGGTKTETKEERMERRKERNVQKYDKEMQWNTRKDDIIVFMRLKNFCRIDEND